MKAGFIVGHALFAFMGHGFTGPHDGPPLGVSALAHTIGLVALGLTVFNLQRSSFRTWLRIPGRRVVLATLLFVVAFQFGAYALRPPFDYVKQSRRRSHGCLLTTGVRPASSISEVLHPSVRALGRRDSSPAHRGSSTGRRRCLYNGPSTSAKEVLALIRPKIRPAGALGSGQSKVFPILHATAIPEQLVRRIAES